MSLKVPKRLKLEQLALRLQKDLSLPIQAQSTDDSLLLQDAAQPAVSPQHTASFDEVPWQAARSPIFCFQSIQACRDSLGIVGLDLQWSLADTA
jgi:hypothetical protein